MIGENDIVGVYKVEKAMIASGDGIALKTRGEAAAELEKRRAAGETDGDEIAETLQAFDSEIEFTSDHKVKSWMPLPEGVSEEDIKEAIEAGEIREARGNMICVSESEWKSEEGKLFALSGENSELFGEEQSPWEELVPDENGLIPFGSGIMMLKKK